MRIRWLRPKPKIEYCDLNKTLDLREISYRASFILSCEICLITSTKGVLCRNTREVLSNNDSIRTEKKRNTD